MVYYVILLAVLLIGLGVFLRIGHSAVSNVDAKNVGGVPNVVLGFLTVDGLLLGLRLRLGEVLKSGTFAKALEALLVFVLSLALLASAVTLMLASFTNDIDSVRGWLGSTVDLFYFSVAFYSGVFIITRIDILKK